MINSTSSLYKNKFMDKQKTEQTLKPVFNEFVEFYIPDKYKKQFREKGYIAGGCIYSLANDKEPKDYDFFISDKTLADKLVNEFRNSNGLCSLSDNAVTLNEGKYQIITRYIGTSEDVYVFFLPRQNNGAR